MDCFEGQNECVLQVGVKWQPVERFEEWHHMVRILRFVNGISV